MDKEAATILAKSIDGLKDAFMFAAIAYQKHTVFQQQKLEADLKGLEELINETDTKEPADT
jgi:hypothetical protein